MNPKISVIVPVFNTEQYLVECVNSILHQTYHELEVLLIDDGSTDASPSICDELAEKDDRVRVYHTSNKGVSAARNRGIERATGDYLTFVDSDDWLETDMYRSMMDIAQQYNCDIVLCDCVKDDGEKQELYTHDIRPGFYNSQQLKTEYYPHLLMMENVEYPATISNCLILHKRRLPSEQNQARSVYYIEGIRHSEDLLYGAEIMLLAKTFYYLKGFAFYHYRMNPKSASHTFHNDKWDNYLRLYSEAKLRIVSEDFNFEKQIDLMLLFFLYNELGDLKKSGGYDQFRIAILKSNEIRQMFKRLNMYALPVSWKLKIRTLYLKYRYIK